MLFVWQLKTLPLEDLYLLLKLAQHWGVVKTTNFNSRNVRFLSVKITAPRTPDTLANNTLFCGASETLRFAVQANHSEYGLDFASNMTNWCLYLCSSQLGSLVNSGYPLFYAIMSIVRLTWRGNLGLGPLRIPPPLCAADEQFSNTVANQWVVQVMTPSQFHAAAARVQLGLDISWRQVSDSKLLNFQVELTCRFSRRPAHTFELQRALVASVGSWTSWMGTSLRSKAPWNAPWSRGVLILGKSIIATIQSSAFQLKSRPPSFPFVYPAPLPSMSSMWTKKRVQILRFIPYSSSWVQSADIGVVLFVPHLRCGMLWPQRGWQRSTHTA